MLYFFNLVITEIYSGCFVLDKAFVTIFTPFDHRRDTDAMFDSMINNDDMLAHRNTITLNLIEESDPSFMTKDSEYVGSPSKTRCENSGAKSDSTVSSEEFLRTFIINMTNKVDFERRKLNFSKIKMRDIVLNRD
jgi:hypothetical protein